MARTESSGTDGGVDASSAASALADASFVRVVASATGDAVAAAGQLGRALADRGTPFQVCVARTFAERTRRVTDAAAADETVVVGGANDADADALAIDTGAEPASVVAWRVARELGASAADELALAGVVAAGHTPGAGSSARVLEAAEATDRLERRPGVAGPTGDVVDALAHSTLLHASFSGSPADARDALTALGLDASGDPAADSTPESTGALDEIERRRVASYAAVDATGHRDVPPIAGDAIERVLRPHEIAGDDAAFATVAGYADVLDVLAETTPGTAVALALGHDVADGALDAWRDGATVAHAAVRECERSRHAGLTCVHDVDAFDDDGSDDARDDAEDVDAPLATVARVVRDYRSPEPVVAAFGDGAVALAATHDSVDAGEVATVRDALGRVTTRTGGEYDATATRGYATLETTIDSFVTELREAL